MQYTAIYFMLDRPDVTQVECSDVRNPEPYPMRFGKRFECRTWDGSTAYYMEMSDADRARLRQREFDGEQL